MAARRLAASAVDWAAFAERVYPNQIECFRAFKAKSDGFIAKYVTYTVSPGSPVIIMAIISYQTVNDSIEQFLLVFPCSSL